MWVHEVSVTPIMMEERSHCFLSHPSASKWTLIEKDSTCSKYTERLVMSTYRLMVVSVLTLKELNDVCFTAAGDVCT